MECRLDSQPMTMPFKNMKAGATFICQGYVMMRVFDATERDGIVIRNAVRLNNGQLWTLSDGDMVTPVIGEFVYEYAD